MKAQHEELTSLLHEMVERASKHKTEGTKSFEDQELEEWLAYWQPRLAQTRQELVNFYYNRGK